MANRWRCGACGYRLEADAPPGECPGCHEKCDFIDDNPYVPVEGKPPGAAPIPAALQPRVVPEKCNACLKCIPACPAGAIEMRGGVAWIDPEVCDGDAICIAVCPERAILPPRE